MYYNVFLDWSPLKLPFSSVIYLPSIIILSDLALFSKPSAKYFVTLHYYKVADLIIEQLKPKPTFFLDGVR